MKRSKPPFLSRPSRQSLPEWVPLEPDETLEIADVVRYRSIVDDETQRGWIEGRASLGTSMFCLYVGGTVAG